VAIDLKPPAVTEAASVTKAVPGLLAGGWLTQKRVGIEDRVVFTERLALLLQTGVSLLEALTVMQHQTEQPAVAAVITALAQSVNEGKTVFGGARIPSGDVLQPLHQPGGRRRGRWFSGTSAGAAAANR
jgi:hypothetical protein